MFRKQVVALALAAVMGAAASGQQPREWRDYAGGPDSSRFVAATQITKDNVGASRWRGPIRRARPTSIRWSSRGVDLRPRPEQLVRGARCGDRQAVVDPRRRRGLQHPRRELLGEQGRQGSPADLQRRQHAPGARRADRRSDRVVRRATAGSTCARASTAIRRRSTSRAALPGRVFENLLILGSATNQEYGSAPGDIRAFDVRTGQAGLDVPHRAAARRVRLRHLAEGRVEDGRRRQQLGRAVDRREARHRLRPDRQPEVQLLRRQLGRARTSSATACSRSTRGPASGSGISRPCTTTSGISTTTRRRS